MNGAIFGAPRHLAKGCDFGPKEELIVKDIFTFNLKHEEVGKLLCMITTSLNDAL